MMLKQILYVTRQRCDVHKWYSHEFDLADLATLWRHCIGTKSAVFIKENERLCAMIDVH